MPPDRGSNGRVSYSGQDDSVTFPHAAAVQGNGHYRPAGRQALRLLRDRGRRSPPRTAVPLRAADVPYDPRAPPDSRRPDRPNVR